MPDDDTPGILDLSEDGSDDSGNSGSGSSSSHSGGSHHGGRGNRKHGEYYAEGGDNYPQLKEVYPYGWIREREDGCYEYQPSPQDTPLKMIKKTENSDWVYQHQGESFDGIPDDVKKYWLNYQSFLATHHKVEEVTGIDLTERDDNGQQFMRRETRRALQLIRKAEEEYETERWEPRTTTCVVCKEELPVRDSGLVRLNSKPVCEDHTARELKECGAIL